MTILTDSLMFKLDKPDDPVIYNKRVTELMPLSRLLPRLLEAGNWFDRMGI